MYQSGLRGVFKEEINKKEGRNPFFTFEGRNTQGDVKVFCLLQPAENLGNDKKMKKVVFCC
jgi:hypothetical protein